MKKISLYSDGSSLGNPGPGGYGTILRYKDTQKELSGGANNTTNNQMELLGVIEGLKALKEPCTVEVFSDSKYVTKAINEWLDKWKKNGFKSANKQAIKNYELWQEYLQVAKPHTIQATWVKGHAGHEENERCDELAKQAAKQYQYKE